MRLVGSDEKVGVVHAERIEDALLDELLERHAADLADEIADHVGGDRIIPGLARREFQRDVGEILDHALQRAGLFDLADLFGAIGGIDIAALLEAVGQPRRVAQQVHDQHRPRRRLGQEAGPVPASNTPRFFHSGIYLATGSSSATRPSSTSIMKATEVIGLVME